MEYGFYFRHWITKVSGSSSRDFIGYLLTSSNDGGGILHKVYRADGSISLGMKVTAQDQKGQAQELVFLA